MLGLIELLFIFAMAFGWGTYELYSLRRRKRKNPRDHQGPL